MDECALFGAFGGCVQLVLASICATTLVCNTYTVKRFREQPPRPWSIFLKVRTTQDTSKQGVSALLAHAMNLAGAQLFSTASASPCAWYLINIMLDTTFGVLLAFFLLKTLESVLKECGHSDSSLSSYFLQVFVWSGIVALVRIYTE